MKENLLMIRLKKRSGLFAPGAKLVVREGNKTYTERVSLSYIIEMVDHGIDGKTGTERLMLSNHKIVVHGISCQIVRRTIKPQKQSQLPGRRSCLNLRSIGFDHPATHELFLMSIRPRNWQMIRGPRNWLMIQKVNSWGLGD